MINEHVDDLIDLYALGALEPDEVARVEDHASTCIGCAMLIAESRETVNLLAWIPEQRDPPPELQQKVRRRITDLQRQSQGAEMDAGRPDATRSGRKWLPRWTPPRWLVSTAVLAVILLLVGWNVSLQRTMTTLQSQVDEQNSVISMLRRPGARVVALAPQDAAPNANGQLLMNMDSDYALLLAEGLPHLANDQAFQLWFSTGDARDSAAVFRADDYGEAIIHINSPRPLASYVSCGITIEPSGGSPGPTGESVLRTSLAQPQSQGW